MLRETTIEGASASTHEVVARTVRRAPRTVLPVHEGSVLIAIRVLEEASWLLEWGKSAGFNTQNVTPHALPLALQSRADVVLTVAEYSAQISIVALEDQSDRPTLFICENWADVDSALLAPSANVDFIRRPYDRAELVWRASRAASPAVARRQASSSEDIPSCGSIRYDAASAEVCVGLELVALRRAEREILVHLLKNQHRFVSTGELQRAVLHSHGNGGAVRNQVYQIRKQLGRFGASGHLQHEDGKGYRLRGAGERSARSSLG